VTVFIIILWVLFNVKTIYYALHWEGIRSQNPSTSARKQETYRCPFEISSSAVKYMIMPSV
jgi:hypothetical protein